jgi:hypothetical protein
MTRSQPICEECFKHNFPAEEPIRLVRRDPGARCCVCGGPALTGIYIQVDPERVPHPS